MDHIAIMRKSWGLTEKILDGRKVIESRWYKTRYSPFDRISAGDIVYFKNSGKSVTLRAEVSDVKQFSDLTQAKVREILDEYGERDGIDGQKSNEFFDMFKDKRYCVLIFLKNPVSVAPFNVNKKGFGAMASWICINNIDDIKKN